MVWPHDYGDEFWTQFMCFYCCCSMQDRCFAGHFYHQSECFILEISTPNENEKCLSTFVGIDKDTQHESEDLLQVRETKISGMVVKSISIVI